MPSWLLRESLRSRVSASGPHDARSPASTSTRLDRRSIGLEDAADNSAIGFQGMLLRPEYLSQKLDRPLPTKDGSTLHTIGEAVAYMTGIGKKRELLSHWQRVAKLILASEDVLTVSRALELALFMDVKLVLTHVPTASKARQDKPALRRVGRR
jgi:hypothetical protein